MCEYTKYTINRNLRDAMLSLNAGEGSWPCHNLICQALLTPHGRPYPLGGVDGGWTGREVGCMWGRRHGRGNCDWNVK